MDTIFIKALRASAIIGVYEWEKTTRQTVMIDIEMSTDIRHSAKTDNIEDTINYQSISERMVSYIEQSRFELVETLADKLAALVIEEFNVKQVRLTLHKPGALDNAEDVGILIERTASQVV